MVKGATVTKLISENKPRAREQANPAKARGIVPIQHH